MLAISHVSPAVFQSSFLSIHNLPRADLLADWALRHVRQKIANHDSDPDTNPCVEGLPTVRASSTYVDSWGFSVSSA